MAIELRSEAARAIILPEHGGRLHQLYVTVGGKITLCCGRRTILPSTRFTRIAADAFPWRRGPIALRGAGSHSMARNGPSRLIRRLTRYMAA